MIERDLQGIQIKGGLAFAVRDHELSPSIGEHLVDDLLHLTLETLLGDRLNHPTNLHGGVGQQFTIAAHGGRNGDDTIFGQLLPLFEHVAAHDPNSGGINELDTRGHFAGNANARWVDFDDVTVVDNHHVVGRDAHALGRFRVLHQHAVLAVDGQKILGPGEGQHQLVVFLGTVTRDVNAFVFAIDHLSPAHHELIDGVNHCNGIAWNGVS